MDYKLSITGMWIRNLLGAFLVGMLLGFSGAFGTHDLPLFARLTYWISSLVICTIIANIVATFLEHLIDSESKPIIYHIIFLTLLAFILPIFIISINHFAFGQPFSTRAYTYFFIPVFIVSLFMTVLHYFMEKIPLQSHANDLQTSQRNFRAKIFDRLDIKFRNSKIYAVKSEDHYLRIFTSIGETMILLRLYDAISELEGIEGVQTHRSWWVSIDAIERLERDYGKNRFILKNSVEVPISRGFAPSLKRMKLIPSAQ